jgi:hypothetical protein
MNRKLLIFTFFISLSILVACSKINNNNTNENSQSQIKSNDLNLNNEISTNEYSVFIPEGFSYEKLETGSVNIKKGLIDVGGLFIQPYYSDLGNEDPILHLLPNHSEVVSKKNLDGFFTETQEISIITSQPAVSGNGGDENWIHIFFVCKDKGKVYDLFFNTKYVDEDGILKIAKSFKLK